MRCSICRIRIDLVEAAVEEGWTPYFYDLDQGYELACSKCSEALLQIGSDGEMEVEEEFRGKLKYLDERTLVPTQEDLAIGIAIIENEVGKLN